MSDSENSSNAEYTNNYLENFEKKNKKEDNLKEYAFEEVPMFANAHRTFICDVILKRVSKIFNSRDASINCEKLSFDMHGKDQLLFVIGTIIRVAKAYELENGEDISGMNLKDFDDELIKHNKGESSIGSTIIRYMADSTKDLKLGGDHDEEKYLDLINVKIQDIELSDYLFERLALWIGQLSRMIANIYWMAPKKISKTMINAAMRCSSPQTSHTLFDIIYEYGDWVKDFRQKAKQKKKTSNSSNK